MQIHGLQKMTLLDFPGHVACTVFLGGCDLRCPFCHNYELADGTAKPVMDDRALMAFLKKRQGLLDGVAITGGEPCLHTGLPDLLRQIRALGFQVKLDTNGFHPGMLRRLLEENLVDYVAMDIKNSPSKYAQAAGLETLDLTPLEESIALLMKYGNKGRTVTPQKTDEPRRADEAEKKGFDYEFRTTVVQELHEADDFEEIGEMIKGARRYFLQGFVDRDTVPFEGFHAPAAQDMQRYAQIVRRYVPNTEIRGVEV